MKRIVVATTAPTGTVHTLLAADAIKKIVASLRKKIEDDAVGEDSGSLLSADEITAADVVILAPDMPVERARFAKALIEAAAELAKVRDSDIPRVGKAPRIKKFVAVTVCPDTVAHTFIAAASLRKAAKALGHEIKIKMQDSVGAKNSLTTEEIAAADAVLIASETYVDISRFVGKPLYCMTIKQAIHAGKDVLSKTLEQLMQGIDEGLIPFFEQQKFGQTIYSAPYRHLMSGISYMLPMVTAGGLIIALSFALGGISGPGQKENSLPWVLNVIGMNTAFPLFVAMLSGFIAYSIAGRPSLVPGFIGGLLAQNLGAGFLGGIVSGFLAGYLTSFLAKRIRLPDIFECLKSVLILPFLSSLVVSLTIAYLIAPPVQAVLNILVTGLHSMQGINALLFGMLLGGMMALDVGGPVNKAAFTFALGLLASQIGTPIATVVVAGMTPPLGSAIAAWVFKNRFDREERAAAGSAFILGLSFITEGAIPFVAKSPLTVLPALVTGSAIG